MNWKVIFSLSVFGLLMSFVTLYHIPVKLEQLIWVPVFLISGYFIARYCEGKYFLTGFIVSAINCILGSVVHILLYGKYLSHHPEFVALISKLPQGLSPYAALVIIDLAKGLFLAMIAGIFAFIMARGIKKIYG